MNKMCLRLCDNRSKSYYEGNGIEKETEVQACSWVEVRRRLAFLSLEIVAGNYKVGMQYSERRMIGFMKLGTSIYQDRLDLNIRKHLSHDFFPFCFEKKAMNHFIIILVVFFFSLFQDVIIILRMK